MDFLPSTCAQCGGPIELAYTSNEFCEDCFADRAQRYRQGVPRRSIADARPELRLERTKRTHRKGMVRKSP